MQLVTISRFVLLLSLIFCGTTFYNLRDGFNLSADIKDLSPAFSKNEDIKAITNRLTSDIESRFTLLVTGSDSTAVNNATETLIEKLSSNTEFSLLSSDPQNIVNVLTPYRFNLLTTEHQNFLNENTNADNQILLETAQRNLFTFDSNLSIVEYTQDPLGFFNAFLLNFLNSTSVNTNTSNNENTDHVQNLNYRLNASALDLNQQLTIVTAVKQAISEIESIYSVKVMKTGVIFFAEEAARSTKNDIQRISTGSSIGITLLLLLIFRSPFPLLLALTSIGAGVAFATALSHTLFNSIHILTIVFGASLTGIVVDYTIHFFYHNTHNRQKKRSPDKTLLRALMLSALTTIIGYSALSFSSLPALYKIALFSCASIAISWFCVVALGPLLPGKAYEQPWASRLMGGIKEIAAYLNYKKILLTWGILLAAAFGLFFSFGYHPKDNPQFFFNPSPDLLQQQQFISQRMTVFEPGQYVIIQGETPEEVHQHYQAFNTVLVEHSSENPLITLIDALPSTEAQQNNYELHQPIYAENGTIATLFPVLGIDPQSTQVLLNEYSQAADNFLTPKTLVDQLPQLPPLWIEDHQQFYAIGLIKTGENTEAIHLAAENNTSIYYINIAKSTGESLKTQRESAQYLLLLAYLFVGLMLFVRYRSVKNLYALLIPATASTLTLIILVLIGTPINLFTVMALYLVLGLGMDYVIFVMEMPTSKLTEESIFFSTLTSLLSFGLLGFSAIPIAHSFGITLLIGNCINFIATLFFSVFYHSTQTMEAPNNDRL